MQPAVPAAALLPLPADGDEREERAAALGAAVTAIYVTAEVAILAALAAAVKGTLAGHGNAPAAAMRLSRQTAVILALAGRQASRAVTRAGLDPVPGPVILALQAAAATASGSVAGAFQQAISAGRADNGPQPAVSVSSLVAAQKVLTGIAAAGITGMVTAAGARLGLASYAGMAAQTGASRAWSQMAAAEMLAAGHDLVLVSHGSEGACPACIPWIGHLLSLSGTNGPGTALITDAAGVSRGRDIAGTMDEALAAGWNHPRCRCWTMPWADGTDYSRVDSFIPPSPAVLAARYAAEQKQHALDRAMAAARRRQAAAIIPQERSKARRALATARAALAAGRRRLSREGA